MASGSQLNWKSEPLEPSRVWTAEEWKQAHHWREMPRGPLRSFLKQQDFLTMYGGGPNKIRDMYNSAQRKGIVLDVEA